MEKSKKSGLSSKWIVLGGLAVIIFWGVSMRNDLVKTKYGIDEAWANVQTEYQSRADKVKNLVATVKGAAKYENETLIGVIEKRAEALKGVNIKIDELTPEKMAEFEKMQSQFTGSLGKLLAVFENYPDLQAVQSYRDFQHQYEGIENRIAKARKDFNGDVKNYNYKIKSFPRNIVNSLTLGYDEYDMFEADTGTERAPDVSFE